MTTLLDQAGEWHAAAERLRSVPGIGPITAGWLLVETLAFTTCASPQQAAAFAGLAPHPYESGRSVRRRGRIGHGGNAALRRALSMASPSVGRHNPHIKAFYERLRAAGKPVKVARCAAARKLLHFCWAVVMRDIDDDPHDGLGTPDTHYCIYGGVAGGNVPQLDTTWGVPDADQESGLKGSLLYYSDS